MKFAYYSLDAVFSRIGILLCWVFGLGVTIYFHAKYNVLHTHILCGVFYFLSIIWIWTYIVLCWLDPGFIENYYIEKGHEEELKNNNLGQIYPNAPPCPKCSLPKPVRTHHCSICNKCIVRFDHHCPVIGNCVGLNNIKAFILISFYGGILVVTIGVNILLNIEIRYYGVVFGSLTLFISLCLFMHAFGYFGLIMLNTPTIETFKDTSIRKFFDEGCLNNLKEIYPNFFSIFVPTRPKTDPYYWNSKTDDHPGDGV